MKKYKAGKRIKSVAEYENARKTERFFMMNGKPKHIGFLESMQYRTLAFTIYGGRLNYAELSDEYAQNSEETDNADKNL